MFGILEKMDRWSNKLMSEEESIDFIQEIIDNGMVWKMHEKYIYQASEYLAHEKCFDMTLIRKRQKAVA